jgi:predicted small lipoprotein YifL
MTTNKLLRNIFASLNVAILLMGSGCGLKGDLYIPEKEPASAGSVSESSDDSDESDTDPESKAD